MEVKQLVEENHGMQYFTPIPSDKPLKKIKKRRTGRRRRKQNKMAKNANLEEEEEEESHDEEEEREERKKGPDWALFRELVAELDEGIGKCLDEFYEGAMNAFEQLLENPRGKAETDNRVPALFLRGHCLDWQRLFDQLSMRHPDLTIIRSEDGVPELPKNNRGKKAKLLLFLNAIVLHTSKEVVFSPIFERIQQGTFVFIAVHTPTTFAAIDERLPRLVHSRLRSQFFSLPLSSDFTSLFFSHFPLGILHKFAVQIHGQTLISTNGQFQRECRSLANARKLLVLALLEYAINYGNIKRPNQKRQEEFTNFAKRYSVLLELFMRMTEGGDCSGRKKLELHCQIQSDPLYFDKLYSVQKEKWQRLPGETWRTKFRAILKEIVGNSLFEDQCKEKCEELARRLEEIGHQKSTDERENEAPIQNKKALSSLGRRSQRNSKSALFFARQQESRNRLTDPLPAQLRSDLFDFLDSLFLHKLDQFPAEFVAGPSPIHLCGVSLSAELDHRFGELPRRFGQMDQGQQLDIAMAYKLLVNHNSNSILLSALKCAFSQLIKPDGVESQDRFMAAISQLEHLGAVKPVSDEFVRLIYLPGAALTKDLFETDSTSAS